MVNLLYIVYEGHFYVRRASDVKKTAKGNTYIVHLERLSFYLHMQPKTISKCITLISMTDKRQRNTYN